MKPTPYARPVPGVAIGEAMGWIVLTWNGNQWQDDRDGNVHKPPAAQPGTFLACRAAGWDAGGLCDVCGLPEAPSSSDEIGR